MLKGEVLQWYTLFLVDSYQMMDTSLIEPSENKHEVISLLFWNIMSCQEGVRALHLSRGTHTHPKLENVYIVLQTAGTEKWLQYKHFKA